MKSEVAHLSGDSFRGATWVSLHNGGGVGWGDVINGGFGLLLDGSEVRIHTFAYDCGSRSQEGLSIIASKSYLSDRIRTPLINGSRVLGNCSFPGRLFTFTDAA